MTSSIRMSEVVPDSDAWSEVSATNQFNTTPVDRRTPHPVMEPESPTECLERITMKNPGERN